VFPDEPMKAMTNNCNHAAADETLLTKLVLPVDFWMDRIFVPPVDRRDSMTTTNHIPEKAII
jgi:hypothetical protein